MIEYILGDITKIESGLLLHSCNCQGAFGSGCAGAIKKKWPIVYSTFKECPTGKQMLGAFVSIQINDELTIGNCYGQLYYGNDGRKYASTDAIKQSLETAYRYANENNISTISMPKIGAGLGGLNWKKDVEPIVLKISDQYDNITTRLYYIE